MSASRTVVLGDEWSRGAQVVGEALVGGALLFFGRRRGGVIGFALGSIGGFVLRRAVTSGMTLMSEVRAGQRPLPSRRSRSRDAVDASWRPIPARRRRASS